VRLVREGNVFSAYLSTDGSHWILVGTDTISMPTTVYVGLVVTSRNAAALATAKFSNVAISTPTSSNTPPTVSMSSPKAGATYTAPATMSLSATAGDVDGIGHSCRILRGRAARGVRHREPVQYDVEQRPSRDIQSDGGRD
jgi:hypothetical protein